MRCCSVENRGRGGDGGTKERGGTFRLYGKADRRVTVHESVARKSGLAGGAAVRQTHKSFHSSSSATQFSSASPEHRMGSRRALHSRANHPSPPRSSLPVDPPHVLTSSKYKQRQQAGSFPVYRAVP